MYVAVQSTFRELEPHEIDLVSGGMDPGEEIIVNGYTVYDGGYYDPTANNTSGGEGGDGTGGVFAWSTPGVQVIHHTQDCSTPSGVAVQIANHLKGTAGFTQASATDGSTWNGTTSGASLTGIEFSGLIVQNGIGGNYGTWFNQIWTRDSQNGTFMPTAFPGLTVGYFHNHPDRGDDYTDAHDSYPSPSDWNVLEDIKASQQFVNPNLDPSLWLMDPNGVVREFKLSEKAYFTGLSLPDMGNRVGLAGRERTASCGG
jgi:hypothetical protein